MTYGDLHAAVREKAMTGTIGQPDDSPPLFALLERIEQRAMEHPRSHQTWIGPSELGTRCSRALATILAEQKPFSVANWYATVGTAVHTWLGEAIDSDPASEWLSELKVTVGEIRGRPVVGHLDAFHLPSRTVIDFKVVGTTTLAKAKKRGFSARPEYEVQPHAYGRGMEIAGIRPERVALCFLPASGALGETVYVWQEYDPTICEKALVRCAALLGMVQSHGLPWTLGRFEPCEDGYCWACSSTAARASSKREHIQDFLGLD